MDTKTLIASMEFGRARLLGTLEAIEKSGANVQDVLAWRPGPGRAHIAWQLMHCAATHDRYLNVGLLGAAAPKDEPFVAAYGGGSTPADSNIPTPAAIRDKLGSTYADFKRFVETRTTDDLAKMVGAPGKQRTLGESIVLLAWHEAHHQGQAHLTWNLYKAAHGIAAK